MPQGSDEIPNTRCTGFLEGFAIVNPSEQVGSEVWILVIQILEIKKYPDHNVPVSLPVKELSPRTSDQRVFNFWSR